MGLVRLESRPDGVYVLHMNAGENRFEPALATAVNSALEEVSPE